MEEASGGTACTYMLTGSAGLKDDVASGVGRDVAGRSASGPAGLLACPEQG
jgi:hypothetical protein